MVNKEKQSRTHKGPGKNSTIASVTTLTIASVKKILCWLKHMVSTLGSQRPSMGVQSLIFSIKTGT